MLTANQNHSDKLCLIIRTKPDDNDMKLCFEDHCIIGDCDGYVRWVGARISVSVWHTDTDIKKAHQG